MIYILKTEALFELTKNPKNIRLSKERHKIQMDLDEVFYDIEFLFDKIMGKNRIHVTSLLYRIIRTMKSEFNQKKKQYSEEYLNPEKLDFGF